MLPAAIGLLWLCGLSSAMMPPLLTPGMETRSDDCVPGSVWTAEEDCNVCFCMEDGLVVCTKNTCHQVEPGMMEPRMGDRAAATYLPPMPETLEERNNTNCTDGEQWAEQCNLCKCTGDGMAVCTTHPCDGGDSGESQPKPDRMPSMGNTKSVSESAFSGEMCQVGDTWDVGCSHCTCQSAGQMVCTYSCNVHSPASRRVRRQAQQCVPGTTVKVDCNVCHCMRDGGLACSRRACLPAPAASQQTTFAGRDEVKSDTTAGCVDKRCPADCGVRTDDNGCVIGCSCEPTPYFGSAGRDRLRPSVFGDNQFWRRRTPALYWA